MSLSPTFPFENTLLPNESSPTISDTVLNNEITNPDNLIVGMMYNIYFTDGRSARRKKPSGRRTRTRDKRGIRSRRRMGRMKSRIFKSNLWGKLLSVTQDGLTVQPVYFEWDNNLNSVNEFNQGPERFIARGDFDYANLETLAEHMEDPYYEAATEPYRWLLVMYSMQQHAPHGAYELANAYRDVNEMYSNNV